MLTFLAPAAFLGLGLLAIPVLIHIFKPRKMRPTPFSSLRFLRSTQHKLSRRIRPHQLLLFAARASLVIALVTALALPWVSSAKESRPVDRFIVVDVSRSMAYQPAGLPTPMARAKAVAGDLLKANRAGDRTAVLFTGSKSRVVTPLTADPRPFLPAVEAVEATSTDTRLGSSLRILHAMLATPRDGADQEIVILTDNPRQGWSPGDVSAFLDGLPGKPRVRVVDVGTGGGSNAWITGACLTNGGKVLQVDLSATGAAGEPRVVRAAGLGEEQVSPAVKLEPGQPLSVNFHVPPGFDPRGKTARVWLDPPDALPSDDEFFVPLDSAGATRVLLVEASATQRASHLRAAVEVLAERADRPIELNARPASDVREIDVRAADVILLAGVPELPEPATDALKERVRLGAGLAVFLGESPKPQFYNSKLHDPLNPATALLPVALGRREVAPEPIPLSDVRWSHRLLIGLDDPEYGDLSRAKFRAFMKFEAAQLPPQDTVLARVGGEAAIIEHPVGAGRVLLFNTSADDSWTTLPRRAASFVPLVDRVLTYLSPGNRGRSIEAGEPVVLGLPDWSAGETVKVVSPSGASVPASVSAAGGQAVLRVPEANEPGVYRVERGGKKSFPFVVNSGREDSLLAPADSVTQKAWWGDTDFAIISADEAKASFGSAGGLALWPWLLAAAIPLLLLETYLVHRLCPRVNPAGARMIVRRSA
jgi:hypothetical protein